MGGIETSIGISMVLTKRNASQILSSAPALLEGNDRNNVSQKSLREGAELAAPPREKRHLSDSKHESSITRQGGFPPTPTTKQTPQRAGIGGKFAK